nr:MAG TPA: hypothetical protein [Caudoviricetes sp.]
MLIITRDYLFTTKFYISLNIIFLMIYLDQH